MCNRSFDVPSVVGSFVGWLVACLIQMGIIGVKVSLMQNQQVVSQIYMYAPGNSYLLAKDAFCWLSLVGEWVVIWIDMSWNPFGGPPETPQLVSAN